MVWRHWKMASSSAMNMEERLLCRYAMVLFPIKYPILTLFLHFEPSVKYTRVGTRSIIPYKCWLYTWGDVNALVYLFSSSRRLGHSRAKEELRWRWVVQNDIEICMLEIFLILGGYERMVWSFCWSYVASWLDGCRVENQGYLQQMWIILKSEIMNRASKEFFFFMFVNFDILFCE